MEHVDAAQDEAKSVRHLIHWTDIGGHDDTFEVATSEPSDENLGFGADDIDSELQDAFVVSSYVRLPLVGGRTRYISVRNISKLDWEIVDA